MNIYISLATLNLARLSGGFKSPLPPFIKGGNLLSPSLEGEPFGRRTFCFPLWQRGIKGDFSSPQIEFVVTAVRLFLCCQVLRPDSY